VEDASLSSENTVYLPFFYKTAQSANIAIFGMLFKMFPLGKVIAGPGRVRS